MAFQPRPGHIPRRARGVVSGAASSVSSSEAMLPFFGTTMATLEENYYHLHPEFRKSAADIMNRAGKDL